MTTRCIGRPGRLLTGRALTRCLLVGLCLLIAGHAGQTARACSAPPQDQPTTTPAADQSTPAAPAVADPASYLAAFAEQAKKDWPRNRRLTIVCHGHSVPAGYFRTPRVDTFNAYPHLTHVGVKEKYPNAVINVIVTAIGGENSTSGARRFEDEVLSLKPDVVTIDYCLNDRGIGLEVAEGNWRVMIEAALRNDIPVILLTPTPDQRSDMNNPDDPLNQHAEQVRRLAAEYEVGLVDSLAAFKAKVDAGTPLADLMSQVNHPNRAGHELVAEALSSWFPE